MNEDQYLDLRREVRFGQEFQRLTPNTKQVAFVASFLSKFIFGEILVCTSIFRKQSTDSGVHSLYRAIDFQPLTHIQNTYRLLQMMNSLFVYDARVIDTPEVFKPEELLHREKLQVADQNAFHGTACHIHLQTHPCTTHLTKHLTIDLLAMAGKDSANFQPIKLG